ncbi:MAG TPA: hypothetical protein VHE81_19775 [Lacipirellulaceae bacterium]|nr:hypothetical protein [Lacipirellulaceae bacterium]
MTEIILTNDQLHQLASATDDVVIADGQGNVIVRFAPKISEEEAAIIEEAKRRLASNQPTVPFSHVLKRLKALEQQEGR